MEDLDNISVDGQKLVAEKKLLTFILGSFQREIYDNIQKEVLAKSEICYRSYVFDTSLKSCTRYLRDKGYDITFLPGEIDLKAMTVQLEDKGSFL
ncbi:hypothetical protein PS15p_211829 [Mucor circinelloides]